MHRYQITSDAREDLKEIARYTYQTWGRQQANRYLKGMYALFVRLAETPGMGRVREDIRKGLLSFPTKEHIVFYRVHGKKLIIVRVLLASRDLHRFF
jgi:toxin ParE1/3/4